MTISRDKQTIKNIEPCYSVKEKRILDKRRTHPY